MTDTSGRNLLALYEKLSRSSYAGRTFLALLIGQKDWYSSKCWLIWKLKHTKYGRSYFQLYPKMRHIEGIGSGLLLTPSTVDIGISENRIEDRTVYRESIGRHYVPGNLTEQIMGLLPTPTNSMVTYQDFEQAKFHSSKRPEYSKILLPTPATRDYKGARSTEALEESGRTETNNLPDHFHQTGTTSQLNPLFVTEMMGYPVDWLILPFQSGETNP